MRHRLCMTGAHTIGMLVLAHVLDGGIGRSGILYLSKDLQS